MNIFLSYATEDREVAHRLRGDLVGAGNVVFQFDESAMAGQVAWDQVISAIDNADVFIVLLSPASVSSLAVNYEIDHAFHRYINEDKLRLVPVVIEATAKPPELRTFSDLVLNEYDRTLDDLLRVLGTDGQSSPRAPQTPPAPSPRRTAQWALLTAVGAAVVLALYPQVIQRLPGGEPDSPSFSGDTGSTAPSTPNPPAGGAESSDSSYGGEASVAVDLENGLQPLSSDNTPCARFNGFVYPAPEPPIQYRATNARYAFDLERSTLTLGWACGNLNPRPRVYWFCCSCTDGTSRSILVDGNALTINGERGEYYAWRVQCASEIHSAGPLQVARLGN